MPQFTKAVMNNVDPSPVSSIEFIKNKMKNKLI